jgi:hypothetical protein
MRRIALIVICLAVLVVPSASGAALGITYSVVSGTVGDNGWYRSGVSAQIFVTGATTSNCPSFYEPTSNAYPALDCSAGDGSGAAVNLKLKFKIDTDAPSVTGAGASRNPDANGWYNHAVSFAFIGSDATSGIASCTSAGYSGPDGASSISGTCRDNAGNVSPAATYPVKYDATPPSLSPASERGPDANGWFNHPVTVSFPASDPASGVASCTQAVTYSGPYTEGTAIAGSCTDNAGNTASAALTLKYDASAPRLADLDVELGNGTATLKWQQPADTAAVVVERSPGKGSRTSSTVYQGHDSHFRDTGLKRGVSYRYTLRSRDRAGNLATSNLKTTMRPLFAPAPNALLSGRPRLAWMAAPGAAYYNVQLFKNGHKVLTSWPLGTSFTVPRAWRLDGKRHRLTRGTYRWYVWPGRGARSAASYGALLGSSSFRIR